MLRVSKLSVVMSTLFCEECNTKFVIPRKRGTLRPSGHIKHMYCHKCKKTQPFIEEERDKSITFWDNFYSEKEEEGGKNIG